MKATTKARIAELVRNSNALLFQAAVRFNRSQYTETEQANYSDADTAQMLKGLTAIMLESLEDRGNATRTMIMESMIPGLVAAGENPATMAHWVSGYMTLVSCELVCALPDDVRSEAIDWFSDFTAHYTSDTVRAAMDFLAKGKG